MAYRVYSSPLLACVQKLVRDRPASLSQEQLAQEVGCSRAWLSSFSTGNMPGVSAQLIEKIYVRLAGKQLVDHVSEHSA